MSTAAVAAAKARLRPVERDRPRGARQVPAPRGRGPGVAARRAGRDPRPRAGNAGQAGGRHPGRTADPSFTTVADLIETYPFEEQVGNGLVVREPIGVVGCHHAVELSAEPDRRQGGAGARRRVHGGAQAQRGHAAVRVPVRRDPRRRRLAAGRVQPCVRLRPGGGRSHRCPPRRRHGVASPARPAPESASPSWPRRPSSGSTLELGGKSPNVILDDADIEKAVTAGVAAAYANCGQTCSALTRMLVPRSKLAEAEEVAGHVAESYTVGDPFAEATRARAAGVRGAARTRAGLHREGHRRGRPARDRRSRTARRARARASSCADRVLQRQQRHGHRAGGDLRPGACRSSPTTPRRRRSTSPTTRSTDSPRVSGGRRRRGPARGPQAPQRPGQRERRPLHRADALRRLQAVGQRPRVG